jgi:hypothetical protein
MLVISSSPSLNNIAPNFKPLVLAKSPYFHGLWYSFLNKMTIRVQHTIVCVCVCVFGLSNRHAPHGGGREYHEISH